jgi:NADH-quinone oxidoreductase subunit E
MHMSENVDEAVNLALMEPVLAKHKSQRGAVIPILQQVQSIYGYLPRPALELMARRLGLPISRIYGVATFYSQFYLERRGRHILKVCDGTACHVKGTPALLSAIREEYGLKPGETTKDFELTMEVVYCLGSCALAPVAVLDEKVVGNLRRDQLSQVVRKRIEETRTPAEI